MADALAALDVAVASAFGWPSSIVADETALLDAAYERNGERATKPSSGRLLDQSPFFELFAKGALRVDDHAVILRHGVLGWTARRLTPAPSS